MGSGWERGGGCEVPFAPASSEEMTRTQQLRERLPLDFGQWRRQSREECAQRDLLSELFQGVLYREFSHWPEHLSQAIENDLGLLWCQALDLRLTAPYPYGRLSDGSGNVGRRDARKAGDLLGRSYSIHLMQDAPQRKR